MIGRRTIDRETAALSAPIVRPSYDDPGWRERRRVRALLLDELAAYPARGRFPRNLDLPELPPVFVGNLNILVSRC